MLYPVIKWNRSFHGKRHGREFAYASGRSFFTVYRLIDGEEYPVHPARVGRRKQTVGDSGQALERKSGGYYMGKVMRLVVIAASLQVVMAASLVTAGFGQSLVGVNLSSVDDYSAQLVFVDFFRQSRPWMTRLADGGGPYDTGQPVPLGPRGFPAQSPFDPPHALQQIPHTLMARDIGGRYPAGEYALRVEGTGEVRLAFDAGNHVFSAPCRVSVSVSPTSAGIALALTRSDAADPVRHIQLLMPGAPGAASPFYQPFMRRLKPFALLRFMDMQRINNSTAVSFANSDLPGPFRTI